MVKRLRFTVGPFNNLPQRTNPSRPALICRLLWNNLRVQVLSSHASLFLDVWHTLVIARLEAFPFKCTVGLIRVYVGV